MSLSNLKLEDNSLLILKSGISFWKSDNFLEWYSHLASWLYLLTSYSSCYLNVGCIANIKLATYSSIYYYNNKKYDYVLLYIVAEGNFKKFYSKLFSSLNPK